MAHVRLSGSVRVIRPLPVKLLSGALFFTVALLAALGWFVSTAHTQEDVDRTLEAVSQALQEV